MFIVKWEGASPPDKGEWIDILRDVLASELGSYRIVFRQQQAGWRFALDWRPDDQVGDDVLVANTPDSVAFNIYMGLADRGKPVDPGWRP
jgi:hypothetical protein